MHLCMAGGMKYYVKSVCFGYLWETILYDIQRFTLSYEYCATQAKKVYAFKAYFNETKSDESGVSLLDI